MYKILIASLSLLVASVAGAVDRELEEKVMLENIEWLAEESSNLEYNGEPLPAIVYATQDQLSAYFYGLDKWVQNQEDLVPVEGIFRSEGEGTIFLLDDFDWESNEHLDVIVHELVHYLQYINDISYDCSIAAELDAYKYQTYWMMGNPSSKPMPSYLMAIWIFETCLLEAMEAEDEAAAAIED
jgi:hypothetical protein